MVSDEGERGEEEEGGGVRAGGGPCERPSAAGCGMGGGEPVKKASTRRRHTLITVHPLLVDVTSLPPHSGIQPCHVMERHVAQQEKFFLHTSAFFIVGGAWMVSSGRGGEGGRGGGGGRALALDHPDPTPPPEPESPPHPSPTSTLPQPPPLSPLSQQDIPIAIEFTRASFATEYALMWLVLVLIILLAVAKVGSRRVDRSLCTPHV